MLSASLAEAFARVALHNVAREYPRHVAHLLTGAGEDLSPRKRHPVFYGSYDWHSAVHMHWLLARVLPSCAARDEIAARLDAQLAPQAVQRELEYFNSPAGKTFERPYGWAWLLELQAELLRLGERKWSDAVQPLAAELARRLAAFVAGAPYPIRAGSHGNTAFACLLGLDFARTAGDSALASAIGAAARRWYGSDRHAPLAYEPSLDDFLSPSLVEAAFMREALEPGEFRAWAQGFLTSDPGSLATPSAADREDPKQSHLDGLALSRAWCLRKLGYDEAAERHLAAALPLAAAGPYAGTHWLASFAALALGERP
ncbi:MAG: hypothetical protein K0R40_2587 [Burkholderiales bacterium]|nr:hypothetical protein [Burkholderiales bacterium]